MTDLPPELVKALEERDRSRRALSPPTPGTAGRRKKRALTKSQKAARRRNRG